MEIPFKDVVQGEADNLQAIGLQLTVDLPPGAEGGEELKLVLRSMISEEC